MPKLKDEQNKAVLHDEGDILVSASAGSGKTFTMIERAKRLIIEKGVDVSEILAVTFTEAAAFDMKEKLKKALAENADGENKGRLLAQLAEIPTADISTLHSFCGRLIRQYFFIAGVSPDFKIIDEAEAAVLRAESVDKAFKEFYDSEEEWFYTLIDRHAVGRSDGALKETVLSAFAFINTESDPNAFLDVYKVNYSESGISTLVDEYSKKFHDQLRLIRERLYDALIAFTDAGLDKSISVTGALIADVDFMLSGDIYNSKRFENYSSPRLDFDRKLEPELLCYKESVVECRDKLKKLLKRFLKHVTDRDTDESIAEELLLHTEGLVKLIKRFSEIYGKEKLDENALDFNDLEHFALKILSDPNIRTDVQKKYKYIFVDEYQDINGVQEDIISKISSGNVFMVGDVKQSIYGFRGCKPEIFSQKAVEMQSQGQAVLKLNHNFRSADAVINMVNAIFKYCMTEEIFGENYRGKSELVAGGIYPEQFKGRAELHFLKKAEKEKAEKELPRIYDVLNEKGEESGDVMHEASLVADIINEELTKKFYDPKLGCERKVGYGDVAILTRNKSGKYVTELVKGLKKFGIPVSSDVKENVCDFPEIAMLISALKAVDCMAQDIPLAATMKSPIGNFTDEDLFKIVEFYKENGGDVKGGFYDAYSLYLKNGDGELKEKLNQFDKYFNEVRVLSDFIGAHGVLSKLIKDKNLESCLLCERNGRTKLNRLIRLVSSSIKGAEKMTVKEFLIKAETSPDAFGFAECGEEETVKAMTIHASKGLEFPVVIVCGLERAMNSEDERDEVLFSRDYGLAVKRYDDIKRTKEETLLRGVIKEKMRLERMKEEMRLLYVAVTRATYSLHLTFEDKSDNRKAVFSGAERFADYIPASIPATVKTVEDMNFMELKHGVRKVYVTDPDRAEQARIKQNLEFNYVYDCDTILPLKSNVTAATKIASENGEFTYVLFDEESTDKEKGIIAHKLLEFYDFTSGEPLSMQVKNMVENGILTSEDVGKINVGRIATALSSEVFKGLKFSADIYREKAFLVGVEGKKIFGGESDEQVVLQGVIDLLIIDGKDAKIVDYKYSALDKKSLKEKYYKQLELYAYAVEKVLGLTVSKKVLLNLFTGEVCEID